MELNGTVVSILISGFGIMFTLIATTWHISNRFGRVENRLTRIETQIGLDSKE